MNKTSSTVIVDKLLEGAEYSQRLLDVVYDCFDDGVPTCNKEKAIDKLMHLYKLTRKGAEDLYNEAEDFTKMAK